MWWDEIDKEVVWSDEIDKVVMWCLESNGDEKDCSWWYECDNTTGSVISNRFVAYLIVCNHD